MPFTRRAFRSALLLPACYAAGVLSFAVIPASAQTARPALSQLAQDVQSLYRDAELGTVRVRIPLPMLAGMPDLRKWEPHLDADVLERLHQNRLEGPLRIYVDRAPERQPATEPAATQPSTSAIERDESIRFRPVEPDFPSNEHIGLVLDDKGHVLLHSYVDPRAFGGRPIRAMLGRKAVEAAVVGSDRQTRLTVLRLAEPLGKPLSTSGAQPAAGTLVMMLGGGRQAGLILWTGANREQGLVINIDGAVAGFARGGQIVNETAFKPIVEQILEHGVVKRAKLGVAIEAIAINDPLRQKVPGLGDRAAIRIAHVIPNSAAYVAGLRGDDIVLSLAGEPVTDVSAFAATIAHCRGDTELKVLRGGNELTINVDLQPE